MSFFDRFRSAEKLRERNLARLEDQERAKREAFKEKERERAETARSKWVYDESVDEMRGVTTQNATLFSENIATFDFPYDGGSKLAITLRRHGRQAGEVLLGVTKGQFDYDATQHQVGTFRFNAKPDAKQITSWTGVEPSGGSSSLMFLSAPFDFIRMIQNAERIIIEPSFYQRGPVQFRFDPVGLANQFRA